MTEDFTINKWYAYGHFDYQDVPCEPTAILKPNGKLDGGYTIAEARKIAREENERERKEAIRKFRSKV